MTRPASLDYQQLLECAHGEMFGPGNARLPAPPMLMFDRITRITEDGGGFGKGQLVADARAQVASAARASGFVLQSADTRSSDVKPVSYLDSQ